MGRGCPGCGGSLEFDEDALDSHCCSECGEEGLSQDDHLTECDFDPPGPTRSRYSEDDYFDLSEHNYYYTSSPNPPPKNFDPAQSISKLFSGLLNAIGQGLAHSDTNSPKSNQAPCPAPSKATGIPEPVWILLAFGLLFLLGLCS